MIVKKTNHFYRLSTIWQSVLSVWKFNLASVEHTSYLKPSANSSSESSSKHETLICKRCKQLVECKLGDISRCQCTAVAIDQKTVEFLETTLWGCLCVSCLKEIDGLIQSLKDEPFPTPSNLRKGFHFYIDHGLYVFTERYHLLRGNCCESGCRHCPFGFKK